MKVCLDNSKQRFLLVPPAVLHVHSLISFGKPYIQLSIPARYIIFLFLRSCSHKHLNILFNSRIINSIWKAFAHFCHCLLSLLLALSYILLSAITSSSPRLNHEVSRRLSRVSRLFLDFSKVDLEHHSVFLSTYIHFAGRPSRKQYISLAFSLDSEHLLKQTTWNPHLKPCPTSKANLLS